MAEASACSQRWPQSKFSASHSNPGLFPSTQRLPPTLGSSLSLCEVAPAVFSSRTSASVSVASTCCQIWPHRKRCQMALFLSVSLPWPSRLRERRCRCPKHRPAATLDLKPDNLRSSHIVLERLWGRRVRRRWLPKVSTSQSFLHLFP